jgi:hypothetical protein
MALDYDALPNSAIPEMRQTLTRHSSWKGGRSLHILLCDQVGRPALEVSLLPLDGSPDVLSWDPT